jgi:hypothetical protein
MQEADHCGKFLLDNLFRATDSALGGLMYWQRSESLSPLRHPASPSRQSADTESAPYGKSFYSNATD